MVRGITNFVQSAGNLLRPHKLQNTYLVIDGKNISFQLHLNHSKGQEFFGGDYDSYARHVTEFFEALLKCNITPIVVFDGNNEEKKLNTNFDRYEKRLRAAASYTPALAGPGDSAVFPLFLRTVFTDVINKLDILVYRCEFAADNDIANLAKELNCPILSQDSDYYIYDVLYLPYNSFNATPIKNNSTLEYYLHCDLYSCKYFLNSYPGLRWEHMTILATVSGNDYIESEEFETFYNKLCKQRGRAARMKNVINFLKNKSFESALSQIMNYLPIVDKKKIAKKIAENIIGYKYTESLIPKCLDIPNFKKDPSLNTDICGKLDTLVYTTFKNYFSIDIFEEDKITEISQSLQSVDINKTAPAWFLLKNQTCVYPAPVFEIAFSIMYFLPAILEDLGNISAHSISYNILSAMNKMMTQTLKGKEVPLKVVCRQNNRPIISKYQMDTYKKDIVYLKDIPSLTKDEKLVVLFEVLGFRLEKDELLLALKEIPSDWHLFLICVIYWKKNAISVINDAHLNSIYLCAAVLKIVDSNIGVERSVENFKSKYDVVLQSEFTDKQMQCNKFEDILRKISQNECVFVMQNLIYNFKFNTKIKFDKKVVHAFAELQSCIYFINALNSMLEEPIERIFIQQFYNDTFLYNTYQEISQKENVQTVLTAQLTESLAVSQVCKYFLKMQQNFLKG